MVSNSGLDCLGHQKTIRVLDAVGFARLQGIMVLKEDQETVFSEVIELIQNGKAEAGQVAASFPFESNYIVDSTTRLFPRSRLVVFGAARTESDMNMRL